MIHCKEEDVLLPEEKSLSLSVEDERGNAVGVRIFSHLTIRSDPILILRVTIRFQNDSWSTPPY